MTEFKLRFDFVTMYEECTKSCNTNWLVVLPLGSILVHLHGSNGQYANKVVSRKAHVKAPCLIC